MEEINYIFKTNNLTKKYKEQYALNNVNMHIEKGDIYGFVGENGAGKTTVIRLICGLISPTEGSFELFGVDNKDKGILAIRRKINGIVEAVSINKNMTALDNLKFQCMICNLKKSNEELEGLLDSVGLKHNDIKNKLTNDFSLGMRQRLGLAIAMLSNPEYIILDEPMNGLDPQGFIDVREAIIRLNKMGVTFLISSHILSELDKVCNRIGFISHGVILEELTIDELHHKARRKIQIKNKAIELLKNKLIAEFDLKEILIENNTLSIYDDIDINVIMRFLVNNDITVEEIGIKQDTIEDYYISLIVGGNRNA
jgi:ABC-2 type transport system ATP-binding protein